MKKSFALLLLVALASGCATNKVRTIERLHGILPTETANNHQRLALQNYSTLRSRYHEEWKLNKGKDPDSHPPIIGVSLSGGGSRSAAFSLGILSGLSRVGVLDNTDVISSVSGGGYIASWYYLQHFYSDEFDKLATKPINDKNLFDLENKYQIFLAQNGELVGRTTNRLPRYLDYTRYFLYTVGSWPVNLVANGVFGLHENVVPIRKIYQNGIEREYHSVPSGDDGRALNGHIFRAGVNKEINFEELPSLVKKWNLPVPIINTTAHINDESAMALSDRVFEFTPFNYGSDYYGYANNKPPVTVNTAYTVSGGAFDSHKLNNWFGRMVLSAFNVDLGYYIPNYNLTKAERTIPKFVPFPFYFFTRYRNDINGHSIYLADGGHAENLGAFSLIRRLTKNIIISDAEADPDYEFGAYQKLRNAVKEELNAKFIVEDIDRWLDCKKSSEMDEKCRVPSKIVKPVMKGTISNFPFAEKGLVSNADQNVVIQVLYIKPIIDDENLHNYPEIVQEYYKSHKDDGCNNITSFGPFPQESTADQTYVGTQLSAYRSLGNKSVIQHESLFKSFLSTRQ